MSKSPHRSFERIAKDSLWRLGQIALDDFADLCRRKQKSTPSRDQADKSILVRVVSLLLRPPRRPFQRIPSNIEITGSFVHAILFGQLES